MSRSLEAGDESGPKRYAQVQFELPVGAAELLLIRHGQSADANEGEDFELLDGHGNPGLSELGRAQAIALARNLSNVGIGAIYTSTLRRTIETAEPLVSVTGLTPVRDGDLREVFLGDWEGGTFRKMVLERHPDSLKLFEEQRWDVIPNAEPEVAFAQRIGSAVDRIASSHPDQTVAVFTHGAAIGEILAQASGSKPFAFIGSDNGSISRFVVAGEKKIIRGFNDTSHLTWR